ncbi:MAG: GNAT family N-acetyltransferase, partial [Planctomycetes bacterium]|nr:GNAT family N-acetyltransferase [Planctomycetota bacterium]
MSVHIRGDGLARDTGLIMATNSLRIRSVDPRAEGESIRAVLLRNLPDACLKGRYERLYLGNPLGPARVWLAEEGETGEVVGTSAAHIREVRVDGTPHRALNLSDFAVDSAYRSLGPALALLRATLAPVQGGEFAFSYDLPSQAMAAIYRRCKGMDLGPMVRLVLPLAAAPIIRRRFGDHFAARLLGKVGDLALGAREIFRTAPKGIEVTGWSGPFGEEFDRMDERLAASIRVRGVRSARLL